MEVLTTPAIGVEYEYNSVADLLEDFEHVLHDGPNISSKMVILINLKEI